MKLLDLMILSGLPQTIIATRFANREDLTRTTKICDFPGYKTHYSNKTQKIFIISSAYQMRYGDLCEEKMFNAKIKYGDARVLELLWAMKILEVKFR